MKQVFLDVTKVCEIQDKAYFHSETYINLEATDVKETLSKMIFEILNKIATYQLCQEGQYQLNGKLLLILVPNCT